MPPLDRSANAPMTRIIGSTVSRINKRRAAGDDRSEGMAGTAKPDHQRHQQGGPAFVEQAGDWSDQRGGAADQQDQCQRQHRKRKFGLEPAPPDQQHAKREQALDYRHEEGGKMRVGKRQGGQAEGHERLHG